LSAVLTVAVYRYGEEVRIPQEFLERPSIWRSGVSVVFTTLSKPKRSSALQAPFSIWRTSGVNGGVVRLCSMALRVNF